METDKPISLEPVMSLTEINDTTFFGGVSSMNFSNGRLYIADNRAHLFQLDSNLNLSGVIHRPGEGPGEFRVIMDMSIVGDTLYAYEMQKAKILIYDQNNNFMREISIPDAFEFDFAADPQSRIILSTPAGSAPITMLDGDGNRMISFGNPTVSSNSAQYRRNYRFLFIHENKLIAIGKSEPILEIYTLEGELINSTEIIPPEIHDIIERAKRENEEQGEQPVNFLSLIFMDAAIYGDSIYLLESKRPNETTNEYDTNFTYLFKYNIQSNGTVSYERTFKLYHTNPESLLYGAKLAVLENHKMIVYDMMEKSLLVFEDDRL